MLKALSNKLTETSISYNSNESSISSTTDFSLGLVDSAGYRWSSLVNGRLGLAGEVTAIAVDPIGSWFAVGTSTGSIHLTGAPSVNIELSCHHRKPDPSWTGTFSVKFLCFHPGHSRLIAIDSKEQVHVWALDLIDPRTKLPHRDATLSLFGKATSIDLPSPSTSHLTITLRGGETIFLDLARQSTLAPYRIPNVWQSYEERQKRSGLLLDDRPRMGPPMATAAAVNPRDLNLILVGYEGGCIVWDITQKTSFHTFELVHPPGAPGGGTYQDDDLFTERSPNVQCLAWRPDGLVFAVGYDDGCIAFWGLEDSDKPLSVRTLAQEDVNMTDAEELFNSGVLDKDPSTSNPQASTPRREPIFKFTWTSFPDQATFNALISSPPSDGSEPPSPETASYAERGETLLTVLGGQLPSEQTGVTVLQLPSYQPPTANLKLTSSPDHSTTMSASVRSAFRDSLSITGLTFYPTPSPCDDFILLPRSSPHFASSFDPTAIILLLSPDPSLPSVPAPNSSRGLATYTFPPVRSNDVPLSAGRKEFATSDSDYVPMTAAPILSQSSSSGPRTPVTPWLSVFGSSPAAAPSAASKVGTEGYGRFRMPMGLWGGAEAVLGCSFVNPPRDSFKKVVRWESDHGAKSDVPRLNVRGGKVEPDLKSVLSPDVNAMKFEPRRLLTTWDAGGSVHFYDISPHLLVSPSPSPSSFPHPLPYLSISLRPVLSHPSLAHLPVAKLLRSHPSQIAIQSVHFAPEALELAVVLRTGQVIYYTFHEGLTGVQDRSREEAQSWHQEGSSQGRVEEITLLKHLPRKEGDGFVPVLLLDLNRGSVLDCAVSDAGFFAVSFSQRSLCIVDLRGSEILLREGFGEDGESNRSGESSVATQLRWVVCGYGNDVTPAVRLFVSYAKGLTKVYTLLHHDLAGWQLDKKRTYTFSHDSLVDPLASFVLDVSTGDELSLDPTRLQTAMNPVAAQKEISRLAIPGTTSVKPHCVWLACGRRSIRTQLNVSGERIGKVEMDEDIKHAFLVKRQSAKVLIVFTESGTAKVFALPSLQLIVRLPLQLPLGRISMDPLSGDYIEYFNAIGIELRTLFGTSNKPLPPIPTLTTLPRTVPAQPLPVSSSIVGTWLGSWGGGALTGAQIDVLIAGPARPAPAPRPAFAPLPDPTARKVSLTPSTSIGQPKSSLATLVKDSREARAQNSPYQQMTDAAEERGNILDGLGETMNDVGKAATDWVKQTKRMAAKEGAKNSVKSFLPW